VEGEVADIVKAINDDLIFLAENRQKLARA
jgi:hypothetical protein